MTGTPRFLSFRGNFYSLREIGDLLKNIINFNLPFQFFHETVLYLFLNITPDHKNYLTKSCTDSIKYRVINNCFAERSYFIKLLIATIAGSHTCSQN